MPAATAVEGEDMEIQLDELARKIDGHVIGDDQLIIRGAAPFDDARADEITFAADAKFLKKLNATSAGAVIVPRDIDSAEVTLVQVENPQVAFAKVLDRLHPTVRPQGGIHPGATVGRDLTCGKELFVGACAVIGDNVTLGDRVTLYPGVFIGDHVHLGDDVTVYPNVTILNSCRIGDRVVIHAGSVIGSDGFGFATDGQVYHKIRHRGIVQIDNDVEIGANNTIDRATFGKTWIQQGVKTDNQVHIAHNVIVGEGTVLVAQVGISGSVTIGKNAILAGQAGIGGHLSIGDRAIVGPKTGIAQSVAEGQIVSGATNGMPHRTWLRLQHVLPTLPDMKKELVRLKKQLADIEEKITAGRNSES